MGNGSDGDERNVRERGEKRNEEEFADKREHFVPDARTFRSTAVNFGIVVGIISLTLSPEAEGASRLQGGGGSPEVVGARC